MDPIDFPRPDQSHGLDGHAARWHRLGIVLSTIAILVAGFFAVVDIVGDIVPDEPQTLSTVNTGF